MTDTVIQYQQQTLAYNTLEYLIDSLIFIDSLIQMSSQSSQQPIGPIDVDEMTIDELLALSSTPQKGHKSSKRRMNIAVNPEAKNALLEEIAEWKANASTSFLVYSNGLLITPEGEIANPEDYHLSAEEIDRQVKAYMEQTWMEEDECIITIHKKRGSRMVLSKPSKDPYRMTNECIRIDLPSCVVLTEPCIIDNDDATTASEIIYANLCQNGFL